MTDGSVSTLTTSLTTYSRPDTALQETDSEHTQHGSHILHNFRKVVYTSEPTSKEADMYYVKGANKLIGRRFKTIVQVERNILWTCPCWRVLSIGDIQSYNSGIGMLFCEFGRPDSVIEVRQHTILSARRMRACWATFSFDQNRIELSAHLNLLWVRAMKKEGNRYVPIPGRHVGNLHPRSLSQALYLGM